MGKSTGIFDFTLIAAELENARVECRQMLNGVVDIYDDGSPLSMNDLAFFGFLERVQAFHLGVIQSVSSGNPLAAVTLLRSYAETVAVAFWIARKPGEIVKLHPGATQGFPMGKVIAEADRNLPGFREMYNTWSDFAHPSGAGAFHTMTASDEGKFSWQSHPNFNRVEDARQILRWLSTICALGTRVIGATANERRRPVESPT